MIKEMIGKFSIQDSKIRKCVFILLCLLLSALACSAMALPQAVESVGEVNAKDNSTGTVIAGTSADLILSLIADMSQAEPGEEIAAIRIILPTGLSARENAVKSLKTGGSRIEKFESVVDQNRIIVSLPTLITLTTMVEIEFIVDAPATPIPPSSFIVSLMNIDQNPVLMAITPGNADGRVNNDNLMIKTVAATKPDPPSNVSIQPDPGGENDLIISWAASEDSLVSGYLIFRLDKGDDPIADVARRDETTYIDRSLEAGREFSYTVRSYKTKSLRSDASSIVSAVAPPDTKKPLPPAVQPDLMVTEKGIEIIWEASSSRDIIKYIIYRGSSLDSLQPIDEVEAEKTSYVDQNPPALGSYLYVIACVDDMGNEAMSSATQSRQALSGAEPQPNPFTPLSANPSYNQITFPAALVKEGEGIFAIKIYDLEGDLVFEEEAPEGSKEIRWDGKDMNGEYVASGIYVYQAIMGNAHKIGTIIVAK